GWRHAAVGGAVRRRRGRRDGRLHHPRGGRGVRHRRPVRAEPGRRQVAHPPVARGDPGVTYIFMAAHYPPPGHLHEVRESMTGMAAAMTGTPGLLEIGPWVERDGSRVVGISRWESRAAFDAAMPGSGVPSDVIHPGESKPREYFHLQSPGD